MLIIFLIDANQIAGGALLSTQEVCKECQNNKQNHLKQKKKGTFCLFMTTAICLYFKLIHY